jgi:hypothetical protein
MSMNATNGGVPDNDPCTAAADMPPACAGPDDFLAWDADLEPPLASAARHGVLIVAGRPAGGLPLKVLLPAVVVLILSAGLLGARVARTDWPGLIDLSWREESPPRDEPLPTPEPTPEPEPIPMRVVIEQAAPEPPPEVPREEGKPPEPAVVAKQAEPAEPPARVEQPAVADPVAQDPMAAIREEAARKKAERDEVAKLKEQVGRDMPPPPPAPPRNARRAPQPRNVDQLAREMEAAERRQFAEMQRFLQGQARLRQAALKDLLRSVEEAHRPGDRAATTWPPAHRIESAPLPAQESIRLRITPDGRVIDVSPPAASPVPPPPPRPVASPWSSRPVGPVPPPPQPASDLAHVQ